jgi:hypothetical protein
MAARPTDPYTIGGGSTGLSRRLAALYIRAQVLKILEEMLSMDEFKVTGN